MSTRTESAPSVRRVRPSAWLSIVIIVAVAAVGILVALRSKGTSVATSRSGRPSSDLPTRNSPNAPGPPRFTATPSKSFASETGANWAIKQGELTPKDAFAKEPRDPAWASSMESAASFLIANDLKQVDPRITVSTECRSSMCKVHWDAPAELKRPVAMMVLRLYRGSGAGPVGPNEAMFVYRGQWAGRDVQSADEALGLINEGRNATLQKIRSGDDHYAISRWPADRWPQ
jgi:hypothetical protein